VFLNLVLCRLITDNILAAYETMHTMQTWMWSKVGYMGLKLDMSKAYDRVEWNFLEAMMSKLGFDARWIRLVMVCVQSVSYSVVINGKPVGHIKPTRGIRQGDPISPYLFLLCAESLNSLIQQAVNTRVLTGVPTSKRGPRLSHLFFADDSMVFCKANSVEWRHLFRILGTYEAGSGQKLNIQKTAIFFSRNTSAEKREEILSLSGLTEASRIDTYLGLPCLVGKSRVKAFNNIKDRIWKKLQDWKVKFLSQAGKEILLKAVIQAIPTYSMSVFQLPITLCREINSMMQRFWWGHISKNSKIAWLSWEKMGCAKLEGGLGFRDLVLFNKVLLAKQGWRLLQNPDSLTGKIFEAKYYENSSFLEASLGNRPSFAWRSLLYAKELIIQGSLWRVGDGKKIKIWGDRWVHSPSSYAIQSQIISLPAETRVATLIDFNRKEWNSDLVREVLSEEEATKVLNIPLSPVFPIDRLIWLGTKTGLFSVRSTYHLCMELHQKKQR
jgi:hypothetical protein